MRETRCGGDSWLRLPGHEFYVEGHRHEQQRAGLERSRILARRRVRRDDPDIADVVAARAPSRIRTVERRREQAGLIERADELDRKRTCLHSSPLPLSCIPSS